MAKSRRVSRKAHRKSRKVSRKGSKSRRGSRRMSGGRRITGRRRMTDRKRKGLFSKIYSPVGHLVAATGEAVGTVTNTARDAVKLGLKGVNNIGSSVTGHANAAVRDVFSRKRR